MLSFYKKIKLFVFLSLAVLSVSLVLSADLITEWIWFDSLGYKNIFLKILWSKSLLQLALFTTVFSWYYFNLRVTTNVINEKIVDYTALPGPLKFYRDFIIKHLPLKIWRLILLVGSLVLAGFTTYRFNDSWTIWLQLFNRSGFNLIDPIFKVDVSFYIFVLPLLQWSLSLAKYLIWGIIPLLVAIYTIFSPMQLIGWRKRYLTFGQKHLLIQIIILLLSIALELLIQTYQLLLQPNQLFLGAGFTDINARIPGIRIAVITILILVIIVLLNMKNWNLKIIAISTLTAISIILLSIGVAPALIQQVVVEPNQYAKEKPYLENNIKMTKAAYGLDEVEIRQFSTTGYMDINMLNSYKPTLANIRLWDWRPLKESYNQLQGLTYYYDFANIDIDRYHLDGQYRQVMLAAREIDHSRFEAQAQTWINQKLRYTHGYGLVMSPVNEVTSNGLPKFFIKDIPPVSSFNLKIERPEIYFGELTTDYVITNTKIKEFDYPKGEDNSETIYNGSEGIGLNSFYKRLLFAVKFKDYRMLISREILPESKIIFNRQIVDRVQKLAPFLKIDNDPYLVLNEGKLFWMLDGYTTSAFFPYANLTPGWGNYVRNSVKIIIDAYDGETIFYINDPDDPIVLTWQKIFPDLFQPLNNLAPRLKQHLRYPVDLFRVQAEIYAKYHMENPLVFYNAENAWRIPEEKFKSETITLDPYYSILQLGEHEREEFTLMLPYIPAKKISNMVAWLAALNDGSNYGKLIVYKFYKDNHVYGPMQIESRIDQDSQISQQLSLWDQKGSQVIRGNLLVIPLKDSILYVEPLFLQSDQSSIPELSRVIVVFKDEVLMVKNLAEAFERLFQYDFNTIPDAGQIANVNYPDQNSEITKLAQNAQDFFEQAINYQKEGNWAQYGVSISQLEQVIKDLNEMLSTSANEKE